MNSLVSEATRRDETRSRRSSCDSGIKVPSSATPLMTNSAKPSTLNVRASGTALSPTILSEEPAGPVGSSPYPTSTRPVERSLRVPLSGSRISISVSPISAGLCPCVVGQGGGHTRRRRSKTKGVQGSGSFCSVFLSLFSSRSSGRAAPLRCRLGLPAWVRMTNFRYPPSHPGKLVLGCCSGA